MTLCFYLDLSKRQFYYQLTLSLHLGVGLSTGLEILYIELLSQLFSERNEKPIGNHRLYQSLNILVLLTLQEL